MLYYQLKSFYVSLFVVFRVQCIRTIAMMFVCPYVCLSGMGMHCDHMVHFSANLSLWLDSAMF